MAQFATEGAGRKLVSMLMSAVLAVGLMPLPAFAADPAQATGALATVPMASQDEGADPVDEDGVVEVGSVEDLVSVGYKADGSGAYRANMNRSWVYTDATASVGLAVKFSDKTETETTFDFITIFDGNGRKVLEASGKMLQGQTVHVPAVTGEGTTVRINLTSDATLSKNGFKVESATPVTSGALPDNDALMSPVVVAKSAADLVSDGYDDKLDGTDEYKGYANDLDKTWAYTDTTATKGLAVKFSGETVTEEEYDVITVTDGAGNTVGSYSGRELAGKTVYALPSAISSQGTTVLINLKTDGDTTERGFKVESVAAVTDDAEAKLLKTPASDRHDLFKRENVKVSYTVKNGDKTEEKVVSGDKYDNEATVPMKAKAGGGYELDGSLPEITLVSDKAALQKDVHYTVTLYSDSTDQVVDAVTVPGRYYYRIQGKGVLEGESAWYLGSGASSEIEYLPSIVVSGTKAQVESLIDGLSAYSKLLDTTKVDSEYTSADAKAEAIESANAAVAVASDAFDTLTSADRKSLGLGDDGKPVTGSKYETLKRYIDAIAGYKPIDHLDSFMVNGAEIAEDDTAVKLSDASSLDVNVGSYATDDAGDTVRTVFAAANYNVGFFTELQGGVPKDPVNKVTAVGAYQLYITGKGAYYGSVIPSGTVNVRNTVLYATLDGGTLEITATKPSGTHQHVFEDIEVLDSYQAAGSTVDVPMWNDYAGSITAVSIPMPIEPANLTGWFRDCYQLEDVDLTNVKASAGVNMTGMFTDCEDLGQITLPQSFRPAADWGLAGSWVNPNYGKAGNTLGWSLTGAQLVENYMAGELNGIWKLVERADADGESQSFWARDGRADEFAFPPEIDDDFEYTGSAQACVSVSGSSPYEVVSNADESDSETSATAAGAHKFTLKLRDGYVWGDELTKDNREFTWNIAKAKVTPPVDYANYVSTGSEITGVNISESDLYTAAAGSTPKATAAGNYTVTLQLKDKDNYAWSDTESSDDRVIHWSITATAKTPVDLPKPTDFVYDGTERTGVAVASGASDVYELAGTAKATEVGTYTVTAKLKNTVKSTREWRIPGGQNTTADQEITWSITPANVAVPVTGSFMYDGTKKKGVTIPENAPYTVSGKTETAVAGTYEVTLTLPAKNYRWADGEEGLERKVEWSIAKKRVAVPEGGKSYVVNADGTAVTGVPSTDDYTVTNGSSTEPGAHYAELSLVDDNRVWTDGSTDAKSVLWYLTSTAKTQVAVPTAPSNLVYDGTEKTGVASDSAFYTVSGTAKATNAGSYTARLELKDPETTEWADDGTTNDKTVSWSIAKAKVAVPTGATGRVYNGSDQIGVASGDFYALSGKFTGKNAGSYTATATLNDSGNREWADGTTGAKNISWTIAKAKVGAPSAVEGLVYNGSEQTGVTASDACSLTGHQAANAGSHSATVTLKDPGNYEWEDGSAGAQREVKWSIAKKKVAAPEGKKLPYTGEEQVFLVDTDDYKVSGAAKGTAGGEYEATVTLSSTDDLEWADSTAESPIAAARSVKWSIVTSTIDVPVAKTGLVYDGTEQVGIPVDDELYTIEEGSGKATDAGFYTAKIALKDPKAHTWTDGTNEPVTLSWEIARKPVTVAAKAASKKYGADDPAFVAAVNGLVGSDTISYRISRAAGEAPGTYAIAVSGDAVQGSYDIVYKGATFTIGKQSLEGAKVTLPKKTYRYTGTAVTPEPTVKLGRITLANKSDFSVSYKAHKKAGTATVTVKGKGNYTGTAKATFKISKSSKAKLDPTITIAKSSKTVRASAVSSKAQTFKIRAKANSGGKLSYKVVKGNSHISFKAGTVKLKKGTAKGFYTIGVQVAAKAKGRYARGSETYVLKFTVK